MKSECLTFDKRLVNRSQECGPHFDKPHLTIRTNRWITRIAPPAAAGRIGAWFSKPFAGNCAQRRQGAPASIRYGMSGSTTGSASMVAPSSGKREIEKTVRTASPAHARADEGTICGHRPDARQRDGPPAELADANKKTFGARRNCRRRTRPAPARRGRACVPAKPGAAWRAARAWSSRSVRSRPAASHSSAAPAPPISGPA